LAKERDLYDETEVADAVGLVVKAVEDCERGYHDNWVEKVERRYDAYRALTTPDLARGEDDEDWHSNVTTPYVMNTCEGMLATMLEPKPKFDVKPRPLPEEMIEAVMQRMKVSDVLEDTLGYALERDYFVEKQRPFMQQDLIAGMSVFKTFWNTERRDVVATKSSTVSIYDMNGEEIDSIGSYEPETTEDVLVKDDACAEVWDVRDFFWPMQAPNMDKAEYVVFRSWESLESLKRKEQLGYYKNVSKINDERSVQMMKRVSDREMKLRGVDRTKNLVEVLEYWTPERKICVANRTVELDDKPNPFWNGRIPAVVCSSMPDAFQIPGISVVEALAQLQEMLWTLQNQRLDVLRMLANLITLIRSDVDDPDSFEWAPNAQWFVEDPAQVQTLPIDPTAANITLQAETYLKGDLQNIMGGLPYGSGADSGGGIDQETATGMSIITSIAQRIIQARKQHYLWAYARLGKHFLQLYQQFLSDNRVVRIAGRGAETIWREIDPVSIQGDFDVSIDVTSDSLLRQERRAEAQSLAQLLGSLVQVSQLTGTQINMKAPIEKVLEAFDVSDKSSYFLPAAPAAPMAPPGAGVPPQGGNGSSPTMGVTNPGAAAGPLSPSNQMSMSPETSMARLMSQRGTPPASG